MNSDNSFKENGFLLVKNFVEVDDLYTHLGTLVNNGKAKEDEISGSYTFYKEGRCEKMLEKLLPKMELHTGYKLYKSYSYARVYNIGNVLRAHVDREACEISATICLGSTCKQWPIWILDKDEKAKSFVLDPGDALLFKAGEHTHWREVNTYGACTNLILHYVDQAGQYASYRNDENSWKLICKIPLFRSDLRIGFEKVRRSANKKTI